jgi:hypothetical protein
MPRRNEISRRAALLRPSLPNQHPKSNPLSPANLLI